MARAIDSHISTGDVAAGHEGDHESETHEVAVGETQAHTPNSTADHNQHEIKTKHAEGERQ